MRQSRRRTTCACTPRPGPAVRQTTLRNDPLRAPWTGWAVRLAWLRRRRQRAQSRRTCGAELGRLPVQMWAGAGPVPAQTWQGVSPVPAQMWQGVSPVPAHMRRRAGPAPSADVDGRAQSRRRCGGGEPSPGADVGGVSPVPAQTWAAYLQLRVEVLGRVDLDGRAREHAVAAHRRKGSVREV
jgi:hypothetical protein